MSKLKAVMPPTTYKTKRGRKVTVAYVQPVTGKTYRGMGAKDRARMEKANGPKA